MWATQPFHEGVEEGHELGVSLQAARAEGGEGGHVLGVSLYRQHEHERGEEGHELGSLL